jgi:hypothetical protein
MSLSAYWNQGRANLCLSSYFNHLDSTFITANHFERNATQLLQPYSSKLFPQNDIRQISLILFYLQLVSVSPIYLSKALQQHYPVAVNKVHTNCKNTALLVVYYTIIDWNCQ